MTLIKAAPSAASSTGMLDRSLVSGIAWTASLRWIGQIISWAALLYAARVLSRGDFGIIAMARTAIGFARLAEDFGLDTVLLQNRNLDAERQARLAGFAILLGVALLILFVGLAVPIANFNREPSAAIAVWALSLLFVIDAVQLLPRAMLQRDLQFRRLAIVTFTQGAVTSITLVVAAASGMGFRSLFLNTLAGGLASTALLLWWSPYKVAWPRELKSIVGPIAQGWRVLVSRIAWYGYTSLDQIVIGRMLGKDALGVYSFAGDFAKQPMEEITSIVSRVVPGVFTNVQHDMPQMRRYFLILTEFLSYLVFPVGVGIALTADRVVAVALGPQWQDVVEPLRILCIYAAFLSAQALVAHILLWTGQFRALMWCSILTVVMLLPSFYLGARWGGLVGVAWMWTIIYPLSNIPPLVIGFRTIGIRFADWFEVMRAPLLACGVMIVVVLTMRYQVTARLEPLPALAVEAGSGAVAYAGTLWLMFRKRIMFIVDTVRAVRQQPADAPRVVEVPAA
jgi:teichuronic acid exporter